MEITKPSNITDIQSKKRQKMMKTLKKYREEGKFPINTIIKKSIPIFKDEFSTLCAVGYLMDTTGEKELIKKIVTENNHVFKFSKIPH